MSKPSLSTISLCIFSFGAILYLLVTFSWPVPKVFASVPKDAITIAGKTIPRAPKPTHITIGTKIDLRIQQTEYGEDGWEVSNTAVSFPSSAARPGEAGNIVLYSHNWKYLFGNLSKVHSGDEIVLTSEDNSTHTYKVDTVFMTDQNDILWVGPEDHEVLTLYTCAGFLDLQRLIVRASPIQ